MRHVFITQCLALISILVTINQVHSVCHVSRYTPDDCGLIEEIPGDTRTQIPWTAGIFLKQDDSDFKNVTPSSFTLHSTGVILSPTTVLAVFSGALEKLTRKIRGRGDHPPNHFAIVAGLRSGNLSDYDEHIQVSEVSFIQPHLNHEESGRDFHFVLFHLKTTLDFSTPYVKSICLPYSQLGAKFHQGQKTSLHGGFEKVKIKTGTNASVAETGWEVGLQVQAVETGLGYECVKTYEKYYDGIFPPGLFCGRVPLPEQNGSESEGVFHSEMRSSGCLLQGSAITHKIGHQYYLTGLTTFIRGRKAGLCRNGTVYFNARLSIVKECSPYSFPCSDGTCIPLESVCNSIPNCPGSDSDENEILCEANRQCGDNLHQCDLTGNHCISKEQLCDGFRDCGEGWDESPVFCNRDNGPQGSRSYRDISKDGSATNILTSHCPPIVETDGVQIQYLSTPRNGLANCSFIPEGTFAISKCKPFYKSTQTSSQLEQLCDENGKWSDSSKFHCQPDCGLLNNQTLPFPWTKDPLSLPWHVLLFNLHGPSQKIAFVCGATVISTQYLITSGHCFVSGHSLKSFKVVVAPVSKNFSENLSHERPFITEIDNVWRPEDFDKVSKQGDLALVKIKRPLAFGAAIRPACFLHDTHPEPELGQNINEIQRLPSHHFVTSIAQMGLHIHDFPSVAEMVCIKNEFVQSSKLQCVGHKLGNSVRQHETGGGLVSLSKTKFGSRYVLKGVMSYEEMQDGEPISKFTVVQKYRDWISEIIGS